MQSCTEKEQRGLAQRLPNCRDISCKPARNQPARDASSSFSGQVLYISKHWSTMVQQDSKSGPEIGASKTIVNMKKNNSENTDNRNSQVVLGCDPCPQLQRTASTRSCRDIENSCSSSGYVWPILISYTMSWVISLMQIPAGCKIDC